jgi:hypothetical protein
VVDPEVLHKELVSGNSATLRGHVDTIGTTETSLGLGVQAVHRTSEVLRFSATIYTKTDEYASGMLRPSRLR